MGVLELNFIQRVANVKDDTEATEKTTDIK